MRICVVLPYHWAAARGGAEYQADLFCRYVAASSEHEIIYLARHVPEDLDGHGYRVVPFSGPQLPGGLRWGMWIDGLDLYRKLSELKPDAILQIVASAHTGVCAAYARRNAVPMFWYIASDMDVERWPNVSVDSPTRHIDRAMFRYGLKRAQYVIAQTERQVDRLVETAGIHAGFVVANFLEGPEGEIEKPMPLRVLWIANMKQLKRPELFVDIAERVDPALGVQFVMAGAEHPSVWGHEVRERIEASPRVDYLGSLSVEAVDEALMKGHLLINTSEYEGLPNSFIQGWLREVPTLTLDVDPGGVFERDGIGERLGSVAAVASRIEALAKDPEALSELGRRARAYAASAHSMNNAKRLLKIIETNA